ncbi:MAG: GNAT family N-acetyltransferase [Chloroflexota bacterium]
MPPSPSDVAILTHLDRYLDAAPRTAATTEDIGAFTLFVSTGIWPYYARPRVGYEHAITKRDVEAVRERQRSLGVPESFEWVVETTPTMSAAARETGLAVEELPLLVLGTAGTPHDGLAADVRRVGADEFDLARILAVASVAFANAGTAVSAIGSRERDEKAAADPIAPARIRERIRDGLTVLYVAEDDEGPIASGAHQPVDGVTEIVGVGTLPSARRRGVGTAVTAALVADARAAGLQTIFLSASSDAVARVYERLGFVRVGHAGLASPASMSSHA